MKTIKLIHPKKREKCGNLEMIFNSLDLQDDGKRGYQKFQ
jgi:hypothetical protein